MKVTENGENAIKRKEEGKNKEKEEQSFELDLKYELAKVFRLV